MSTRTCPHCSAALPPAGSQMIALATGRPARRHFCIDEVKAEFQRFQDSLGKLKADVDAAMSDSAKVRVLTGMTIEEIVRMNHGEFDS